jgi:hypothetical protein
MSRRTTPGPERHHMRCPVCGEATAYETAAIAADKLELHMAFLHTAGGCPSAAHPGRHDERR